MVRRAAGVASVREEIARPWLGTLAIVCATDLASAGAEIAVVPGGAKVAGTAVRHFDRIIVGDGRVAQGTAAAAHRRAARNNGSRPPPPGAIQ
jgi:hypothetical protein